MKKPVVPGPTGLNPAAASSARFYKDLFQVFKILTWRRGRVKPVYCLAHGAWHIIQPMLSAILLAAGESKRMGELKQLMPLGESTIIEQAIDNLLASAVGETIVVLGHRAEEIKKAIATKPES